MVFVTERAFLDVGLQAMNGARMSFAVWAWDLDLLSQGVWDEVRW